MLAKHRSKIVPFLLVLLPIWLFVSGGFALVRYFENEKKEAAIEERRFTRILSVDSIKDDLRKTIEVIGERNLRNPKGLRSIAAMIEGNLGPSNTGYKVDRFRGPLEYPLLRVRIKSSVPDTAPIWVITSYDSPLGSKGAEMNASGIVATTAAAQNLANTVTPHPINFLFVPHANDNSSPREETVLRIKKLIKDEGSPMAILYVETMGKKEDLFIASPDAEAIADLPIRDLGELVATEITNFGNDADFTTYLFQAGLPAIRIATGPIPENVVEKAQLPFAPTVAASTGRLITLIKRLSKTP